MTAEEEHIPSVSREVVLKLAVSSVKGFVLGTAIGYEIYPRTRKTVDILVDDQFLGPVEISRNFNVDDEWAKQMISTVMELRRSIKLLGDIPGYRYNLLVDDKEWPGETTAPANNLPAGMRAYGEMAIDVLGKIVGDGSGELVSAIGYSQDNPLITALFGITSDKLPLIIISDKFKTMPLKEAVAVLVHEILHSIDFSLLQAGFSHEAYLKILRGKYMILSQAFNIEEKYLNDPNNLERTRLDFSVGEFASRQIREGDLSCYDQGAQDVIDTALEYLLERQSEILAATSKDKEVVFNKDACKFFGIQLGDGYLNNNLALSGKAAEHFSRTLEREVSIEVFAYMFTDIVMYPEQYEHMPILTQGVREILETLKGEPVPDLKTFRDSLLSQAEDVLRNLVYEQGLRDSVASQAEESAPPARPTNQNPQVEAVIKRDEQEVERAETIFQAEMDKYQLFLSEGKIHDDVKSITNRRHLPLLERYAQAVATIKRQYPTAGKLVSTIYPDFSFDPLLDIEEISKIEQAISIDFIWQLLRDGPNNHIKDIKKYINILQAFIASPAFGT